MSAGVKSMVIIAVAGSGRGCRSPGSTKAGQFTEPNRRKQPSISGRGQYNSTIEIAVRLLDQGMGVDAKAAIDADGFGGHTAFFSTVVLRANFWRNPGDFLIPRPLGVVDYSNGTMT